MILVLLRPRIPVNIQNLLKPSKTIILMNELTCWKNLTHLTYVYLDNSGVMILLKFYVTLTLAFLY